MAPDGAGLTFSATQIRLLRAYPDGPELLLQPDRDDPDRAPVPVRQIVLGRRSGRRAGSSSVYRETVNHSEY